MLALSGSGIWLALLATSDSTPQGWLDFLTQGGLLGGALLIIYGLLTDRLVSGSRHRREIATREREIELWRTAAMRATGVSERVAGVFFPAQAER